MCSLVSFIWCLPVWCVLSTRRWLLARQVLADCFYCLCVVPRTALKLIEQRLRDRPATPPTPRIYLRGGGDGVAGVRADVAHAVERGGYDSVVTLEQRALEYLLRVGVLVCYLGPFAS